MHRGAMLRGGEIDLPCTARGIVTRETPEAMSRTGRTIAPRDNEALATSFRMAVRGCSTDLNRCQNYLRWKRPT